MAKRVDHDSTMEVSSSQLVPDGKKRPEPHRAPGVDKNDVSMWIGGVVGADEFAKAGARKPKRRWVVLVVAAVVGGLGAGGYYVFGRTSPAGTPSTPSTPSTLPGSAAIAPLTLDADTAPATTVDAGVDAAPVDAGAAGGALQADAISGVDANRPPGKKPTTPKKKVVKKKTPPKKPAPKKK